MPPIRCPPSFRSPTCASSWPRRVRSGGASAANLMLKRTRTDDTSIELRVREIINPAFEEWIGRKIDAAELDRRRELAHKQAAAEHSGSPTAVASWATAAAETGVKSAVEARCAAIGPASPDVSCAQCLRPQFTSAPDARPPSHSGALSLRTRSPALRVWASSRSPRRARATWRATRSRRSTAGFIRALLPSVAVTTAGLFPGDPWRAHPYRSTGPPKSLRRYRAARLKERPQDVHLAL